MATFKVSIPENKISFFMEVLELIGASYENSEVDFHLSDDQKKFLIEQNKVPLDACAPALDLYENLMNKQGL
jgi:hypothetical protein